MRIKFSLNLKLRSYTVSCLVAKIGRYGIIIIRGFKRVTSLYLDINSSYGYEQKTETY
jgi:hypothetical protein